MNTILRILALTLLLGLVSCASTMDQARDEESCMQAATATSASAGCQEGDPTWEDMVQDCMEQKGYLY